MGEVDNNNVYMRVLENTMCRIFCMISNDALQNKLYRIDDIEEQVDLICQSCETYPAPFHRGCPYILSNDQLICPRVKPNLPQLPVVTVTDGCEPGEETDDFDIL